MTVPINNPKFTLIDGKDDLKPQSFKQRVDVQGGGGSGSTGIAPTEVEPDLEFDSMAEFMEFVDENGDGKISEREMEDARRNMEDNSVNLVSINGINYNVITDETSRNKIDGTDGNDLIFGTKGTEKIDGNGGDDIIFSGGGEDKIKGGSGDDVIIGTKETKKAKGGSGEDVIMGVGGKVRGGSSHDVKDATYEEVVAKKDHVISYDSMEELTNLIDSNGDGKITKREIKGAQNYFDALDVETVNIAGESYNLVNNRDSEGKKTEATEGNDLVLNTKAKNVYAKGGDDVIFTPNKGIFGSKKTDKAEGGKGNDTVNGVSDNDFALNNSKIADDLETAAGTLLNFTDMSRSEVQKFLDGASYNDLSSLMDKLDSVDKNEFLQFIMDFKGAAMKEAIETLLDAGKTISDILMDSDSEIMLDAKNITT